MNEVEEKKTFKKMLIDYRDYDLKIKHYTWLIKDEEQKEYTIGGGLGDGQPKPTGFTECNAENQIIKKVDNIAYYNQQISILQAEKEFIESMIDTLPYNHQQYIKSRYYFGYSIKQVADNVNIDEKSMANTLQSIIDKLENKYKKLI